MTQKADHTKDGGLVTDDVHMSAGDPVVQAVLEAAVSATSAACGWLAANDQDTISVVAAFGEDAADLVGAYVPAAAGTAGFVIGSGQPLALTSVGQDARLSDGVAALLDAAPRSMMSVPCVTDTGVVAALELADKVGGGSFSFDDVEVATLLAGIAAVALVNARDVSAVPEPGALAVELARLASTDPSRYAAVATALDALLGSA